MKLDLSSDYSVDWKLVVKVIERITGMQKCPICLNENNTMIAP